MMKAHFLRLFEYNLWANELFCKTLINADYQNPKIEVLLSHTYAAEIIWLSRAYKVDVEIPGVWELTPFDATVDAIKRADAVWIKFIENGPDFDSIIRYTNTAGEQHQTVLKDILVHVANHGTHHRSQIATLLREENIAPPASDFIFFCRV